MLFDTSAWIEFFTKSGNWARVVRALDSEECYTSMITIAEITENALRKGLDHNSIINDIERLSKIVYISKEIATLAGQINFERRKIIGKWGMADSIILATASMYRLDILTKDSDFRGIDNAEIL